MNSLIYEDGVLFILNYHLTLKFWPLRNLTLQENSNFTFKFHHHFNGLTGDDFIKDLGILLDFTHSKLNTKTSVIAINLYKSKNTVMKINAVTTENGPIIIPPLKYDDKMRIPSFSS